MPTISVFYGLIITMNYNEHNPPHIHVRYQDDEALVWIDDGEVHSGGLSNRHRNFIRAWVDIHREELYADWQLCKFGEQPLKIDPLK
jgi:hypothetical protein